MMTIQTVARPYLVTFARSGQTFPLTSDEAQRIVDGATAVHVAAHRVVLRDADGHRMTLRPATLGGGPAFLVTRARR